MKVVYLGPEEEIELEDGEETVTAAQSEITEVSDTLGQSLKLSHGQLFWFGDEPEPQHRVPGAEDVMPSDAAREELNPSEEPAAE